MLLGSLAFAAVPRAPLTSTTAPAPASHRVVIENMTFSPRALHVRAGDEVTFENRDIVPHTATAKSAGAFDSGPILPGESWSFRPTRVGSTPFACTFHPTMDGTLIVESAAQ